MAEIRAYVTGMDAVIRGFDRRIDGMDEALDEGCTEAAEYLQECIENNRVPLFFLPKSISYMSGSLVILLTISFLSASISITLQYESPVNSCIY